MESIFIAESVVENFCRSGIATSAHSTLINYMDNVYVFDVALSKSLRIIRFTGLSTFISTSPRTPIRVTVGQVAIDR